MRAALFLLGAVLCYPADPLTPAHLEAMHAQRVEWMKTRVDAPLPGIYADFHAVFAENFSDTAARDARQAGAQIVIANSGARETLAGGILSIAGHSQPAAPDSAPSISARRLASLLKQYPDEVFALAGAAFPAREDLRFRHTSEHILARELTAESVHASLDAQRVYRAQDWLCDPGGFFFVAASGLGTFDIGDTAPMYRGFELRVSVPVSAHIRIRHDGRIVAEARGRELHYPAGEPGDYRALVSLSIAGEELPWIETSPIYAGDPARIGISSGPAPASVEADRGIPYLDDGTEKHKLDLFLPIGKSRFPVIVFLHGGEPDQDDRSPYSPLGIYFAGQGIGVAIPSFRPKPDHPHPAQIEDAAAAFAWIERNIARHGGDPSRVYLMGHSMGGQLASLLALDREYLKNTDAIRGVIAVSGIYSVGSLPEFASADDDPSPLDHVHAGAPRFLILYCQWDAFGLPAQARDFAHVLEKNFVPARLVYLPGENHVSELISIMRGENTKAVIDFIGGR